ncbi:hypothetical protein ACFL0W_01710 [Nanoarchaeota archaeon]
MDENEISKTPWIHGIIDTLTGAKLILNSSIEGRNRLALILLDSGLEIGFKDYLTYIEGIKKIDPNALRNREALHKIVKKKTNFPKSIWESIDYFYVIRCGLYHEDSGKTITNKGILDFFNLLIHIFDTLFSISCQEMIKEPKSLMKTEEKRRIKINQLNSLKDVIITAIATSQCKDSREIVNCIKKMGSKKDFTASKVTTYMRTYSHLFYFDETKRYWTLTDEGQDIFYELLNIYGG